MELFLTLLSGVAWSVVYIAVVYQGFKDKTYGMPFMALALNIAWEAIYTYADVVLQIHGKIGVQGFVNLAWLMLDALIVYTYFKFGQKTSLFPHSKKHFVLSSVLILISSLIIQWAFVAHWGWQTTAFGVPVAAQYSAFLQNLAMSLLFIVFYIQRQGRAGQNLTIATAKWLGTLAPTLLMGVVQEFNVFILLIGGLCCLFDVIYVYLIYMDKRGNKVF